MIANWSGLPPGFNVKKCLFLLCNFDSWYRNGTSLKYRKSSVQCFWFGYVYYWVFGRDFFMTSFISALPAAYQILLYWMSWDWTSNCCRFAMVGILNQDLGSRTRQRLFMTKQLKLSNQYVPVPVPNCSARYFFFKPLRKNSKPPTLSRGHWIMNMLNLKTFPVHMHTLYFKRKLYLVSSWLRV